jgi:hypothetical protein
VSNPSLHPLRRHASRIVALVVIALIYSATHLPTLDPDERAAMADRFAFSRHMLAEWDEGPRRTRRPSNPSMERHSGWMSAVGAAVALADLDGDGLANDVCHVDTRTDRVTVAPAPSTGARYPLFALEPVGVRFDARTTAPMGCVPSDLNEDGLQDLVVYYWGRPPIAFLRRGGVAGPPQADAYVARDIVSYDERWFTNAVTFADLDGDGHFDLVVGNYFQDGARILDARAEQKDSMQHSMSRAYNAGRNRVLRWNGATTGDRPTIDFEEVEGLFPHDADHAWTLAIGAADLDGDLLPELYYANDFGPDRFFHNRSQPGEMRFALLEGERRLVDPRSKVLGRDSFKGMGVDFADVNGDGELDIFVSNIAAEYALEESHFLFVHNGERDAFERGVAPYHDQSEPLGVPRSSWGWDTRFGDFDNDGIVEALQATGFKRGKVDRWPELQELAMGNDELLRHPESWPTLQHDDELSGWAPNPFYVQAASGRYFDLAADLGLDAPHVTRGIATADIDGDGDLDFVIANQWEASYLYRNDSRDAADATASGFLGLRLQLATSNGATRPAIGASVVVKRADGRVLVGQVDGGNGHSGVRSPEIHFGLARVHPAGRPVAVSISYRDREGRPASLELSLDSGWHTLVLPDAPQLAQSDDPRGVSAL